MIWNGTYEGWEDILKTQALNPKLTNPQKYALCLRSAFSDTRKEAYQPKGLFLLLMQLEASTEDIQLPGSLAKRVKRYKSKEVPIDPDKLNYFKEKKAELDAKVAVYIQDMKNRPEEIMKQLLHYEDYLLTTEGAGLTINSEGISELSLLIIRGTLEDKESTKQMFKHDAFDFMGLGNNKGKNGVPKPVLEIARKKYEKDPQAWERPVTMENFVRNDLREALAYKNFEVIA
jgi:hypothetical protein